VGRTVSGTRAANGLGRETTGIVVARDAYAQSECVDFHANLRERTRARSAAARCGVRRRRMRLLPYAPTIDQLTRSTPTDSGGEPTVHMIMRVVKRSPIVYVMSVSGTDVGWFSTGRVGLCGFADRSGAQRAGEIAGATLADWYRARWNTAPEAWEDDVSLHDAIDVGGVCIGRVSARHPMSESRPDSWGVEFHIPHDTWVAVMLELAQRMYSEARASLLADGAESADVPVANASAG
jgi:hypothetical protein